VSTTNNLEKFYKISHEIVGRQAWGVKAGMGSFLTMEFGSRIKKPDADERGEWHFWVYCCSWRIEQNEHIVLGCEDSKVKIEAFLHKFEKSTLESFEVTLPGLDAILKFDTGLTLKLFTINTEDEDQWMLFTPNDKVLVVGPSGMWTYEDA
jgi:hypothetical protein